MSFVVSSTRARLACNAYYRYLHTSRPVAFPRPVLPKKKIGKDAASREKETIMDRMMDMTDEELSDEGVVIPGGRPPVEDELTTLSHMVLDEERQLLKYLRLIEHETPQLVAFRKPFEPPTSARPLVIRSVECVGEDMPVNKRRAIVVPVDALPLNDDKARNAAKLIAGSRWTPEPPKDAAIGDSGEHNGNGYIKISCDLYDQPAMNVKWASDVLDVLIKEANEAPDDISTLPLDLRHVEARQRKSGGFGAQGRRRRPSLRHDFPHEWLPTESEPLEVSPRLSRPPRDPSRVALPIVLRNAHIG